MNPLIRGGDELDQWIDEATREIRSLFMKHWRVIKRWEPMECPARPAREDPAIIYADELRVVGQPNRRWFR